MRVTWFLTGYKTCIVSIDTEETCFITDELKVKVNGLLSRQPWGQKLTPKRVCVPSTLRQGALGGSFLLEAPVVMLTTSEDYCAASWSGWGHGQGRNEGDHSYPPDLSPGGIVLEPWDPTMRSQDSSCWAGLDWAEIFLLSPTSSFSMKNINVLKTVVPLYVLNHWESERKSKVRRKNFIEPPQCMFKLKKMLLQYGIWPCLSWSKN